VRCGRYPRVGWVGFDQLGRDVPPCDLNLAVSIEWRWRYPGPLTIFRNSGRTASALWNVLPRYSSRQSTRDVITAGGTSTTPPLSSQKSEHWFRSIGEISLLIAHLTFLTFRAARTTPRPCPSPLPLAACAEMHGLETRATRHVTAAFGCWPRFAYLISFLEIVISGPRTAITGVISPAVT